MPAIAAGGIAPFAPVPPEKLGCLLGPPRSSRIIREVVCWRGFPSVQNRLDDGPGGLHHVGALEQSRVAHHAVVDQGLVSGLRSAPEILGVFKRHVHRAQTHDRSWYFGLEV